MKKQIIHTYVDQPDANIPGTEFITILNMGDDYCILDSEADEISQEIFYERYDYSYECDYSYEIQEYSEEVIEEALHRGVEVVEH